MDRRGLVRLAAVRQMAQSGRARTVRQRAGVSLGELAGVIGVGKTTVFRWEMGERTPRGDAALRGRAGRAVEVIVKAAKRTRLEDWPLFLTPREFGDLSRLGYRGALRWCQANPDRIIRVGQTIRIPRAIVDRLGGELVDVR